MKRVFWIAFGATAGVLVARQIRATAAQLTPESVVGGLVESIRTFWDDAIEAMGEREAELRTAFGFDDPAPALGDASTLA